jgi:DNA repair protein RadC
MSKKFTTEVNPTNQITNSSECAQAFREIWNLDKLLVHERVYVIYLDQNKHYLYHRKLNTGGYSHVDFDVDTAILYALKRRSKHIILSHNHTSGDCRPSGHDIEETAKIVSICKSLGITLVDHVILCRDEYYSFRDHSLL